MFVRSANNYDRDMASLEAGFFTSPEEREKSLVVQSAAKDADINEIVRRFGLTGEIPVHQRVPLSVDIDEVLDYRTALEYVRAGEASFMSLPADVRATFENDPASFVAYALDPENLEQLRKWGLAPQVAPAPGDVPGAGAGAASGTGAGSGAS